MINFLFLIPVFAILSAILVYKHNGKRDFLRLDAVQFVYAFLISPLIFVWLKSFSFFLLQKELGLGLSVGEIFFIDTLLSVFFLYLFAFVVMHSLTKTFELKRSRDPLYDLFEHSEFFHMDLSHLVIYLGGMLIVTFFSMLNIFIAFDWSVSKSFFYFLLSFGLFGGITGFMGIWNYELPEPNFMRLMKLLIAFFFLIHVFSYFIFEPVFSSQHAFYWFAFFVFLASAIMSLFAERPEKKKGLLQQLPFQLNPKKPKYYGKFILFKLQSFFRK
ncbi:MAG: hypothetical protein ABFQ62_02130 [Patescibacteria group bacterium]